MTSGVEEVPLLARGHRRAAAVPDVEQPALLERADALARDAAADLEPVGEVDLPRQPAPLFAHPRDDLRRERPHHLPVEPHAEIESRDDRTVNGSSARRAVSPPSTISDAPGHVARAGRTRGTRSTLGDLRAARPSGPAPRPDHPPLRGGAVV